jgi:CubicO group peptidase (beta-lactamase class C family)
VAALAALRLVQQGKLSLDADVNSYLVDWKIPSSPIANGSPVTLRELLSHTGGINVHGFPGYAVDAPVPNLVQILDGARPANTPPIRIETAPGKEWNYSGGGYIIMQELIVDVTKEPFPEFVQDTVLAPIGMIQSTYQQPLSLGLQLLAAMPYGPDNIPIRGGAHTYPEMAAAGLWATPSDLARYGLEIVTSLRGQSNHVLSPEMTKQMLTPGLGNWGLGIEIGGSSAKFYFKHGGVNAGFESILFVYEHGGDGAVVMTNAQGGSILADEIMRSIATEYNWPDYRPIVLYSAKTVICLIFAFILLSAIVALVFKLLAALYSKLFAARH